MNGVITAKTLPSKKIALIGLGPHAQRIYYPYLVSKIAHSKGAAIQISLVVDLSDNKQTVDTYLQEQDVRPTEVLYLPHEDQRNPNVVDERAVRAFLAHNITHVIISTEPKAHKAYLKFCIEQGLKVLVDKPITAPIDLMPHPDYTPAEHKFKAANQISSDVHELVELLHINEGSRVIVQAQRRYHEGYVYVRSLLADIIKEHGIPITYINIHHSDGMWNMPEEFMNRENHPYKYGYGKLMHSGYHFVDLLQGLLRLNELIPDKTPDHFTVFNQMKCPIDNQEVINEKDYQSFFGSDNFTLPTNSNSDHDYKTYGELDSFSQWQFTRNGKVITSVQMSLMQSGISLRAWPKLPKDTYKANGRVRHERVDIHLGPLYNIQVHSYQAAEVGDAGALGKGIGSKDHFDILIFKNAKLLGGQSLEVIHYGDIDVKAHKNAEGYLGQNEQPRHKVIDELLDNTPSTSELEDHIVTNRLMSVLYSNQAKCQYGQVPLAEYSYKEIFHE
jgi:predicted dehydrogenase